MLNFVCQIARLPNPILILLCTITISFSTLLKSFPLGVVCLIIAPTPISALQWVLPLWKWHLRHWHRIHWLGNWIRCYSFLSEQNTCTEHIKQANGVMTVKFPYCYNSQVTCTVSVVVPMFMCKKEINISSFPLQ